MELINTSPSEVCVFNYGFNADGSIIIGSDSILEHDDILKTIESNPNIFYTFTWGKFEPTHSIINGDLVDFLIYNNTSASPKFLSKITYENIIRINKHRPKFVVEEFGNIFGNLSEISSSDAANAVDLIKDNIKNYNIGSVKPATNNKILIEVNGNEKLGKLEYGKGNENAISINLDIRLKLDDKEDEKKKTIGSRRIIVNNKASELAELEIGEVSNYKYFLYADYSYRRNIDKNSIVEAANNCKTYGSDYSVYNLNEKLATRNRKTLVDFSIGDDGYICVGEDGDVVIYFPGDNTFMSIEDYNQSNMRNNVDFVKVIEIDIRYLEAYSEGGDRSISIRR